MFWKKQLPDLIALLIPILFTLITGNLSLFRGLRYEFSLGVNIFFLIITPLLFYLSRSRRVLIMIIATPPLIQLILAHNICDPFNGAIFYLLMPATTLPLLYLILKQLSTPERSKKGVIWRYYLILLLFLLGDLWLLYSEPQIFIYNPLWGYFQGPLYDVGFNIPGGIIWLSILKIALILLLWLLNQNNIPKHPGIVAILLLIIATIFTLRDQLGITGTAAYLQSELGGHYRSEHFDLFYPDTPAMVKKIPLIAREHEFHYRTLSKRLNITFNRRIKSYIFKSRTQKKRLMGAGNTLVAKPWQRSIYLNHHPFPHPYIRHELAHVFLGKWSDHFLKIPVRWKAIPLMGLVEGFAVALEEPRGVHTLREEMKLIKIDQQPEIIKKLLSAEQFWGQSGYRAYRISGAFISFLLKKYGIKPLETLYRTGDFSKSYPHTLKKLEQQWFREIKTVKIPEKYGAITEARFNRPSLFKRVCPHIIHRLKQEIDSENPRRTIARIIKLEPQNPEHYRYGAQKLLQCNQIYNAKGYLRQFQQFATEGIRKQQHLELTGDLLWQQHNLTAAAKQYRKLLKIPMGDDQYRRIFIKKAATESPLIAPFIFNYLLKQRSPSEWQILFKDLPLSQLENDIINYLYGRRYLFQKRYKSAHYYLSQVQFLTEPILKKETLKMLRSLYFQLGIGEKLERTVWQHNRLLDTEGEQLRGDYLIKLLDYLKQYRIKPVDYL